MNIKHTIPTQAKATPKRRPFKALAKLAVAGLLIISPPVLSGCCGAKNQASAKEPAKTEVPSIPEALKGYDKYKLRGPQDAPEEEEADGGVEEEVEAPLREVKKVERNPYYPTPIHDCPF